jgi:hypothetical protein
MKTISYRVEYHFDRKNKQWYPLLVENFRTIPEAKAALCEFLKANRGAATRIVRVCATETVVFKTR